MVEVINAGYAGCISFQATCRVGAWSTDGFLWYGGCARLSHTVAERRVEGEGMVWKEGRGEKKWAGTERKTLVPS